jgi:hypothetical protein
MAGKPWLFEQSEITFSATVPHLFPDSLNATVAVAFLNGNGQQVLAWVATWSCKPAA